MRKVKPAIKTRKYAAKRPNVVIYRDGRGAWQFATHATIERAIQHSRRIVETNTGSPVLVCHILYEERLVKT